MKNLSAVILLLLVGFSGCSSTPTSPRSNSIYSPPSLSQKSPIKTSDRLTPSDNFNNNDGYYRALFNMNTSDCRSSGGVSGVYIIKLHEQSVIKLRGGLIGDKIVQIGAHRPRTSSELTYVIKRITPDTVVPIVLDRSGKFFEILVVPPPWEPSEEQKEFIDSPYRNDPCQLIGKTRAN